MRARATLWKVGEFNFKKVLRMIFPQTKGYKMCSFRREFDMPLSYISIVFLLTLREGPIRENFFP